MDSEAGLPSLAGIFHTLQVCTGSGELSLFDVLEQADKYVLHTIPGTVGLRSAN